MDSYVLPDRRLRLQVEGDHLPTLVGKISTCLRRNEFGSMGEDFISLDAKLTVNIVVREGKDPADVLQRIMGIKGVRRVEPI